MVAFDQSPNLDNFTKWISQKTLHIYCDSIILEEIYIILT